MNHRSVTALLLPALLAACTTTDTSESPAKRVGITGTSVTPDEGAFTWRSVGGETTDFGGNDQPACQEVSANPITRQQATELGYAVDRLLAPLDGVSESELVWSEAGCAVASTCPHTPVTISARLEPLTLHSLRPD